MAIDYPDLTPDLVKDYLDRTRYVYRDRRRGDGGHIFYIKPRGSTFDEDDTDFYVSSALIYIEYTGLSLAR